MSNQKKSPAPSKYRVPALEKGLDILECLAATSAPQSLADLARALNRSSSELFRMLNTLEKRRYVIKEEGTGNYRLSLKLFTLAHSRSPIEHLLDVASGPMQELVQTVGESCHLSTLSHGKLVVIAQAESPRKVRLSVGVGREFSPLHTASGRLLLAYLPAQKLADFLAEDADYRQLAPARQAELAGKLAEIRQEGCSIAVNESHLGVKDLSVLVGNPAIGLSAALAIPSLTTPDQPDHSQKLRQALQACAHKITAAIGVKL
jgi:DNA-binding IclR family transcriptional regulator